MQDNLHLINELENKFQLSRAQQRMLFLTQISENKTELLVPFFIKIGGALQIERFMKAVDFVIRSHKSFGFRLLFESDQFLQTFDERNIPECRLHDEFRTFEAMRSDALEKRIKPFDLFEEAPCRTHLYTNNEDEHLLFMLFHHIVVDGVSINVLLQDIGTCYGEMISEHAVVSPHSPVGYDQYVAKPSEPEDEDDAKLSYWRNYLQGASGGMIWKHLPKPTMSGPDIQFYENHIPDWLFNKLADFSRNNGFSRYTVMLACYFILLNIYCDQDEFVVGVPVANRDDVFRSTIGLFVNTLPIRSLVPQDVNVLSFIKSIAFDLSVAKENALPIDIIGRLEPIKGGEPPLIDTILNYRSFSAEALIELGLNIDIRREPIPSGSTHFLAHLEKRDRGLSCRFDYNTSCISKHQVERMFDTYIELLNRVMCEPNSLLGDISSPGERDMTEQLRFGTGRVKVLKSDTIMGQFSKIARLYPQRECIVYPEKITFEELYQSCSLAAQKMRSFGVGKSSRVMLENIRSVEYLEAVIGALIVGACFIPFDKNWPDFKLEEVEKNTKPALIISSENNSAFTFTQVSYSDFKCSPSSVDSSLDNVDVHGHDLAYILFTSGSTGKPKGVKISHKSLANQCDWFAEHFDLCEEDTILSRTPFTFDASIWELFLPLTSLARLVLANEDDAVSPFRLNALMRDHAVTDIQYVPSLLNIWLDLDMFDGCTNLKRVYCGGERLDASLVKRLAAVSKADCMNLYGPTEATVQVLSDFASPTDSEIALGRPVNNTQCVILDPNGKPVCFGALGELYISGLPVAQGYLEHSGRSGFFTGSDGIRYYNTGDLVRLKEDGKFYYHGRMDDQVKIHGERLELGEIAFHIRQIAGVRSAQVFYHGPLGLEKIIAFVTGAGCLSESSLKDNLRLVLPHKFLPKSILILDQMPLTENGKVDNSKLIQRYANPDS